MGFSPTLRGFPILPFSPTHGFHGCMCFRLPTVFHFFGGGGLGFFMRIPSTG
jgi:hypothetical protein